MQLRSFGWLWARSSMGWTGVATALDFLHESSWSSRCLRCNSEKWPGLSWPRSPSCPDNSLLPAALLMNGFMQLKNKVAVLKSWEGGNGWVYLCPMKFVEEQKAAMRLPASYEPWVELWGEKGACGRFSYFAEYEGGSFCSGLAPPNVSSTQPGYFCIVQASVLEISKYMHI